MLRLGLSAHHSTIRSICMQAYSPEIEQAMQKYAATLNEKDRRRYAAIEALKLPHGGLRYIAHLLKCSVKTVRSGLVNHLGGLPDQRETPAVRRRRTQGLCPHPPGHRPRSSWPCSKSLPRRPHG